MNQYLLYAQSLCDSVLRNAEAVHAEYFEVDAQLGCSAKVGYVAPERKPRSGTVLSLGVRVLS